MEVWDTPLTFLVAESYDKDELTTTYCASTELCDKHSRRKAAPIKSKLFVLMWTSDTIEHETLEFERSILLQHGTVRRPCRQAPPGARHDSQE